MVSQPFEGYLSDRSYGESIVGCIARDAGFFEGTNLNERLSQEKQLLVDLGCAVGNELSAFQKKYPYLMTVGIDINEEYILNARENSQKSLLIKASLARIPLADNSVPVLFSSRIFQHENERSADIILREAHRILKPSDEGTYLMLCENFTEGVYLNFLNQVINAGFRVLKQERVYGMILQK